MNCTYDQVTINIEMKQTQIINIQCKLQIYLLCKFQTKEILNINTVIGTL